MAKRSFFKLFSKTEEDATQVLDMLARNHTPIHVEVEQTLIRFKSQLSLKEKAVLFAKPPTLSSELRKGGHVRVRWPGAGRREMRLEVAVPHFNLPNGSVGFICMPPAGSSMPKRKHERYDTSRFSNLQLEMGSTSFRLLDLGTGGCRIALTPETHRLKITLGRPIEEAFLVVGTGSKVKFEHVTPRAQRPGFIGCEFRIKQDGVSPQLFAQVMKSVESRHLQAVGAR